MFTSLYFYNLFCIVLGVLIMYVTIRIFLYNIADSKPEYEELVSVSNVFFTVGTIIGLALLFYFMDNKVVIPAKNNRPAYEGYSDYKGIKLFETVQRKMKERS